MPWQPSWPAGLVTWSLWDCVTRECVQLTDRRQPLAAASVPQEPQHGVIKSYGLTKNVTTPSPWTRNLQTPDGRLSDTKQAECLRKTAWAHLRLLGAKWRRPGTQSGYVRVQHTLEQQAAPENITCCLHRDTKGGIRSIPGTYNDYVNT